MWKEIKEVKIYHKILIAIEFTALMLLMFFAGSYMTLKANEIYDKNIFMVFWVLAGMILMMGFQGMCIIKDDEENDN